MRVQPWSVYMDLASCCACVREKGTSGWALADAGEMSNFATHSECATLFFKVVVFFFGHVSPQRKRKSCNRICVWMARFAARAAACTTRPLQLYYSLHFMVHGYYANAWTY